MKRVSYALGELIVGAIDGLDVPRPVRDGIEWEAMPWVAPDGSIAWLIGIGVRVPATGDWHIPFGKVDDPHDQAAVALAVRALYRSAQEQADKDQRAAIAQGNGHKKSGGGLILP